MRNCAVLKCNIFPVYKYPYLLAFIEDAAEICTTSKGSNNYFMQY